MPPIAAILLAAGNASRMGQTKQLLRIDGQTLVRRAARAALDADCNPVIVVTGADAGTVTGEIADLTVHPEMNPDWSAGIGTSIRRGINAVLTIDPEVSAAVLMLCDQPHLSPEILRDLIAAFRAAGNSMAACQYAGTLGPPCCFARSTFDELQQLADSQGAKKLLLAPGANVTTISWPQGADDLDTPLDWQRFCQSNSQSSQS